jgi:hypothetical protein
MKNRKWVIAAVVLVLTVLNVWRWWPAGSAKTRSTLGTSNPSAAFRPEDFEVRALPSEPPGPMQRDLFRPKLSPRPVAKVPAKPPEPPPKSPEELEREAAQAELAQIRCAGVAVRGGRAQAFLVKGSETFLVSVGDKVGNRFIVDKIAPDAVSLQDPNTGVAGQIAVSGK